MKVFIDVATAESPVRKSIEQVLVTVGQIASASTVQEADAILTDEPEKAMVYVNRTTKRVAQVLWWKQKPAPIPESDRFKIFDMLPDTSPHKGLPGLIEAMAFLKGK